MIKEGRGGIVVTSLRGVLDPDPAQSDGATAGCMEGIFVVTSLRGVHYPAQSDGATAGCMEGIFAVTSLRGVLDPVTVFRGQAVRIDYRCVSADPWIPPAMRPYPFRRETVFYASVPIIDHSCQEGFEPQRRRCRSEQDADTVRT